MLIQYFHSWLKSKSTIVVFIILTLYWTVGLVYPDTLAVTVPIQVKPKFLAANYYGFFSWNSFTCIVSLLFLVLLQHNRSFFDNKYIFCRSSGNTGLFIKRLLVLSLQCLIFLIYIYILIVLRAAFYKPAGMIYELWRNIAMIPLQFMGLVTLALIFCFVSSFFSDGVAGFVCAYAFVAVDFLSCKMNLTPPTFVERSLFFNLEKMTLATYFISLSVDIIVSVSISALFVYILNGKDELK